MDAFVSHNKVVMQKLPSQAKQVLPQQNITKPSIGHQRGAKQNFTSAKLGISNSRAKHPCPCVICAATQSSGLSSVSLGPSTENPSSKQNGAVAHATVADVPLQSEADQDYTVLQECLQNEEFEKADDETRALLIRLAGPDAEKRGWVYFTEVKFIPEADLQTIDKLWKAASNNNFGYSIQKELWVKNRQRWDKFFQQIDWVQGENNMYRKWPKEFTYTTKAARGHLPLTNALRGTRLFQAIMEHPAFEDSNKEKPSWLS